MEKQQYTPGPWKIDDAFKTSTVITDDTDMVICQIHGVGLSANADGRLIASSPDLLEALIMCCQSMSSVLPDFNPFDQAAYDKARAAIAKATGG